MIVLLLIIIVLPALFVSIHFLFSIFSSKSFLGEVAFRCCEVFVMVLLPLLFLCYADFGQQNDCCSESSFFSPDHKLTAYCFILLCVVVYYISSFKESIGSPLSEVFINSVLMIGIVFNVFMIVHNKEFPLWLMGNVPVIMLLLLQLIKNHQLIIEKLTEQELNCTGNLERLAWKMLSLNLFQKIPVFILLALPILFVLAAALLLLGQKPDSAIRMFTDTYKHGLSQLDYMCNNVQCGGHYLCSVAAKGDKKIVKPIRLGSRGGNPIICNRQLLVSNAFEELMEEKVPKLHRFIRTRYDKVGDVVHRYYGIFNIKWVSNSIYFLMKPLEWLFLIVLYLFDKQPENRIAVQYLSKKDRDMIKGKLAN